MCVPGEHGQRWSGHQRLTVLHPVHQGTVAGQEARGFRQSSGRDGGSESLLSNGTNETPF